MKVDKKLVKFVVFVDFSELFMTFGMMFPTFLTSNNPESEKILCEIHWNSRNSG